MDPDMFDKPEDWSALNGTDLILIDVEAALRRANESQPETKDGRIQRRALIHVLDAAVTLTRNIIRAEGN